MNFVAIEGVITSQPRRVELPSGDVCLGFDVRTRSPGEPARSVPVEWIGAPSRAPRLTPDTEVALVGVIQRRFYRAGGVLQSRVYVQPTSIARRSGQRRRTLERELTVLLEALSA